MKLQLHKKENDAAKIYTPCDESDERLDGGAVPNEEKNDNIGRSAKVLEYSIKIKARTLFFCDGDSGLDKHDVYFLKLQRTVPHQHPTLSALTHATTATATTNRILSFKCICIMIIHFHNDDDNSRMIRSSSFVLPSWHLQGVLILRP